MESPTLQRVQDRVERYLAEVAAFRTLPSGLFEVRSEHAVVYVGVGALDGEFTFVEIAAVVLRHVRPTDPLCRHLLRDGAARRFGHFELHRSDLPECVDIHFRHDLLGDYLDREELTHALAAVIEGAREGAELRTRFGGDPA